MAEASLGISGWERALMAAEKVRERLRRATQALDKAGIPPGSPFALRRFPSRKLREQGATP